jgi:hypothetical protein
VRTEEILGLDIPNEGPLFAAVLLLHILAGLTCVVSGTLAATARKRPGRHPRAGRVYLVGIGVIVVTATTMAIVRWEHSAYLLALAIVLAALGSLGWRFRPSGGRPRVAWHAVGMGGSFIVLLTGFYVDNGAQLPLWDQLHPLAYWVIPAAVGIPLIVIALRRYRTGASRRPRRRLRSAH